MTILLGTVVNTAAIIAGGIIGLILKGGIPQRVKETVMKGLALCVLLIGVSGALQVNNLLLVIVSIVLGGILGELIDIDGKIQSLGNKIEAKFKGKGGSVSEAFVTSSLLFCVGAMSIVGSLESGLKNDHHTLFAKAMLDGISSIMFASSLGVGVLISAATVFVYQGSITVCATFLKVILVKSAISDITAVGSLLIIGLSLNMLEIAEVKVANLLPAMLVPIFYQIICINFS